MVVKLSKLLTETAKAEIEIGGSTLSFVFYVMVRERFTDEEWTTMLLPATSPRDYRKKLLPRVVISWDLVDDDEHAVPVTAEAIDQHEIPDALLVAIERRVFGSDLSGKVISNNSRVP